MKRLKKAVRNIAIENKISQDNIAVELDMHRSNVARALNDTHNTTLKVFYKIMKAAGVEKITLHYNENSTITIEL